MSDVSDQFVLVLLLELVLDPIRLRNTPKARKRQERRHLAVSASESPQGIAKTAKAFIRGHLLSFRFSIRVETSRQKPTASSGAKRKQPKANWNDAEKSGTGF